MNRSETLEQLKLSMAAVENLENLTWRMYRVSLFTFDLLREQEFARRFSAFNQAQSNVLLGENRTETSFYVLRDTASQVAVEWLAMATISQANGLTKKCVTVWTGTTPQTSNFKVLLQRGDNILGSRVISWLAKEFDCAAAAFRMSPNDLFLIAASWTNLGSMFELSFDAPPAIANAGLTQLSVSLPFASIEKLRSSLPEDDRDRDDVGRNLLPALKNYISASLHISLDSFQLVKLATSVAVIGVDARIKPLRANETLRGLSETLDTQTEIIDVSLPRIVDRTSSTTATTVTENNNNDDDDEL